MWKILKFAKDMSFLNFIGESYASKVVTKLNIHLQSLLLEIVLVLIFVFVI